MRTYNFDIVINLDPQKITWASSFIKAARKNKIAVVSQKEAMKRKNNRIFIGDKINKQLFEKVPGKNVYFLAASSIYPSDNSKKKQINLEISNIRWSDKTIVVSREEKNKIVTQYKSLKNKIVTLGFPIDIAMLKGIAKRSNKKENSVCFLGELRKIKNPDFEIKLGSYLIKHGFFCTHLSPGKNKYKKTLCKKGFEVIENIKGDVYLSNLSTYQFFIATSKYESLCISGLEAALLNCIPITPDSSGFKDWCPKKYRYDSRSLKNILNLMFNLKSQKHHLKKLNQYSDYIFFNKINSLL